MIYFLTSLKLSTWEFFAFILAYILAIFIAMTFHEFAHAFAAHKMGDPTPKAMGRLTLNPFAHISGFGVICFLLAGFGWAKPVEVNPLRFKKYRRGMAVVSLAGVTTNLILAFVFSGVYFGLLFISSQNLFIYFIQNFAMLCFVLNLSLCFFNLLPIFPLDGFNFIKSFLKPDNKFVQFMYRYGHLLLLIFVATSIFDYFYEYVILNVMDGFFGFWGLFV